MIIKEKNIQKAINDYLIMRPDIVFVMRVNSGKIRRGDNAMYDAVRVSIASGFKAITANFLKTFKPTSVCDLIAVTTAGRLVAIEVKRDGKAKIEPHQHAFIKLVQDAGGVGLIAWSVEQVKAALDA